jgi:hypothetical protein
MATVDAIAQVLTSTLNPDSNVRIAAELSLSELLKNPRKLTFLVAVRYLTLTLIRSSDTRPFGIK